MEVKINQIILNIVLLAILYFASFGFPELDLFSWVGIYFFLWLFISFLRDLGNDIPVRKLLILIALLQWVIAPILSYHFYPDSEFYYMQMPESVYMSFVVPGIFLFHIGLNFFQIVQGRKRNTDALVQKAPEDKILIKRGWALFTIGVIAQLLQSQVPNSLHFAFFLLSKLIYVGSFYLLAARVRFRYIYLLVAFIPLIIGAQGSTVFHDLFLWGGFIFMVYAFINKISLAQKFLFLVAGVFFVLFVQYFKGDYREEIRVRPSAVGTEKILEITENKLEQEGLSEEYFQSVVDRLNQGWIIARIMYVVPQFEPFANGETIKEGISSALIPRFLDPDKVRSGGAYFERFTKIELRGASMNLGLIGEGYANYGISGAHLFLFIVGFGFSLVFNIINNYSFKRYEILLWLPFLFLYVVKAEDDFTTMFNQFTKSTFVCVLLLYTLDKLYPRKESSEVSIENNGIPVID